MKNKILGLFISLTFIVVVTTSANALPLDPIADLGLLVGDTYHYVFVSFNRGAATSHNIADYNAIVTNEANSLGSPFAVDGLDWFAIASTGDVDARDNAVVGANSKVFLPSGTMVADGFDDFWDGNLDNPITETHLGGLPSLHYSYVWTGSNPDGTAYDDHTLGSGSPVAGMWEWSDSRWISHDFFYDSEIAVYYALSQELTVAPVPEPASMLLLGTGLVGLVGIRRRKKA